MLQPSSNTPTPSTSKQQTIGEWLTTLHGRTRGRSNELAKTRDGSVSTAASYTDDEFLTSDERPTGINSDQRSNLDNIPMNVLLDIQTNVKKLDRKLDKMEHSLKNMREENRQLKEQNQLLTDKICTLQTKIEDLTDKCNNLESQSRRQNLRFFNINEDTKETWDQTEGKVRSYIADDLEIDSRDIQIERAHRLPGRNSPRPILVKFSFYKDKDRILQKYKEKSRAHRQQASSADTSKTVYLSEDFPEYIRKIRKQLHPFLQEAIDSGSHAYLRYDKLIIDRKTFVYNPQTQRPEPLYKD